MTAPDDALPMYTVYRRPADLPGVEYAVREFFIRRGVGEPEPGPLLGTAATLAAVRRFVPPEANFCIHAQPGDDGVIVETWV